LQEFAHARGPLQWPITIGNQGVALMLLAGRRGDAQMAKLAVQQIEALSPHRATAAMRIPLLL
jgi:hypothetical protein